MLGRVDNEEMALAVDVEKFYRTYGPMVLRRCRRLLRSEDLAVDAMQDTFLQLIKHHRHIEENAPSRMLYRMATNICLNKIRSLKRHPEDCDEELLYSIASLEEPESRHLARNLMDRLFARERPSTRTMAVLHLVDGMTLEEVASQVGLSLSGVRKRLKPLRERLERLDQQGVGT